ncbi:MAG: hypothetical protein F4X27_14315 [Chloroflexi bacterium]|nr:hypothetical protein [Chloroflexota bacterium]
MANKTGNPRMDYLMDKNAETVRQLEKLAEEKAEENGKLIELIHESRAKRLGNYILHLTNRPE